MGDWHCRQLLCILNFSEPKWSDFQNFISQRISEVSASKCGSEWRVALKIPAAIFFIPFFIYLKKSSLLFFCKTRWLKGFYNISASVQETHSDSEIRLFCPGFCLKSVWILTFSQKCKNQGSFCKCLIINKVLFFFTLPSMGERYENGACFYQPPFLSEKFTIKILSLQTYLVSERREIADRFFKSDKNSVKFFSQNRFTKRKSTSFSYPILYSGQL